VASNIISMVIQYPITGWGTLKDTSLPFIGKKAPEATDTPAKDGKASGEGEKAGAEAASTERKDAAGGDVSSQRKKGRHGKHRGKRKN